MLNDKTFRDCFAREIEQLGEFLTCNDVNRDIIADILESGYFLFQSIDCSGNKHEVVIDGFYGNYLPYSCYPKEVFLSMAKGEFDTKGWGGRITL